MKQFGKDVKVYRKSEIPDQWHYKKSPRIADILVVAELGVRLSKIAESSGNFSGEMVAGHGYDNAAKEMRPMFMARGPAFPEKVMAPPKIHSVDLYLLMCRLLGIHPAPNNGSVAVVDRMLRKVEDEHEYDLGYFGVTTSILVSKCEIF